MLPINLWRSLIFMPANVHKFVAGAHRLNVDAVILDLEDSILPEAKQDARTHLTQAVKTLNDANIASLVRINSDDDLWQEDIQAAVASGTKFLMLPKTQSANFLRDVDNWVSRCEIEIGLVPGSIKLISLIETPGAFGCLTDLANATPRLVATALGTEDLSAKCHFEPSFQNLFGPGQNLIFSARAAGLIPIGLPGSIAKFGPNSGFQESVQQAKMMGFDAVMCIHPSQIAEVNSVFQNTTDEIAKASRIVTTFEQAQAEGKGAVRLDGKMLDLPVVKRARDMLDRVKLRQDDF